MSGRQAVIVGAKEAKRSAKALVRELTDAGGPAPSRRPAGAAAGG